MVCVGERVYLWLGVWWIFLVNIGYLGNWLLRVIFIIRGIKDYKLLVL